MPSTSLFIIISVPYATSVPLYLKTWPKWLRVLSLTLASTTLTLFYLEPLRKNLQTPKSTEPPRPCRYLFSSFLQSTYSPPAAPLAPDINTASTSKWQTSLSVLFIFPNRLTYAHPCTPVIPLVPSDSPALISSLLCLSAYHLALAASASQPLKSGTLSLYLSVPVPVLIPLIVASRPTTASRPSNPLNPSPLAPQIRLC